MMIDISIIIPIFNTWKNIEKIITNINKKKNFLNIEIILIDDCSKVIPLKKIEIIKNIKNVKAFFLKKNKGPGIARNFGLKKASGKFIWFIDSDDMPNENWANSYEKFKKIDCLVDFVAFPAEIVTSDKNKKYVQDYFKGASNKKNSLKKMLGANFDFNNFNNSVWQFWFNKNFLTRKKIFFLDGKNYEDVTFLSNVFNHTKYCLKIDDICYQHFWRDSSITANKLLLSSVVNTEFGNDILKTIFSLINFINSLKNKYKRKFFISRMKRYTLDFVAYLSIIKENKNIFKKCEVNLKRKSLLLPKKRINIRYKNYNKIINLLLKTPTQKLINFYFSDNNIPTALKKRKGRFVVHCYHLLSISWVKFLVTKNRKFVCFIDTYDYGFKDPLYGKMVVNSVSKIKSSFDYIVVINRQKKTTKKIIRDYIKAGFKKSDIYEINYI